MYSLFIHSWNMRYQKLDSGIGSLEEGLIHRYLNTAYYISVCLE